MYYYPLLGDVRVWYREPLPVDRRTDPAMDDAPYVELCAGTYWEVYIYIRTHTHTKRKHVV